MGSRGNPCGGPGRKAQEGEEGREPLCQTGRAWRAERTEGEERQTGRPASSPSRCGGPPCSEQQDVVTSGAWELGTLAVALGTHPQMDSSGQVRARWDFLA